MEKYKDLLINQLADAIKYSKDRKKILDIDKLDIDNLIKILHIEHSLNSILKHNTEIESKFDKFGLELIINNTNIDFYLSDSILQMNIFLENKVINGNKYTLCSNNIIGLDVKGIIFLLSISPKLMLILYDCSSYDLYENRISDEKYINYINLLQMKNSYKYYASNEKKEINNQIDLDFIKLKPYNGNFQKIPLIEGFDFRSKRKKSLYETLINNSYRNK